MYVRATSPRLSRGKSTPAMRAMSVPRSALTLLVARVRADDPHDTLSADHLALLAPRLDRRSNLHLALRATGICAPFLLEPLRDAAPREVVGGQLDLHPVSRQDPDEVHPHLARHVGEHAVAVLQLDPEHRVRERLHDRPLHLDRVVLRLLRSPFVKVAAPP